tara:strand:- start:1058 stop:1801 length:744 start_codon:yes stop_codon:yes gene_type:complete
MVQTLPTDTVPASAAASAREEFVYRPIPASAPLAAGAGALACLGPIWHLNEGISPLSIVAWTFVCGAAGVLGLLTLGKIRKTDGAFSGGKTATTGVILGGLAALLNVAVAALLVTTEVPDGFEDVNFTADISQKGFGELNALHPDVKALDGKKIYLRGFMYRGKQTTGLNSFVIVKDNQQCCFGRQPNQSDMVEVFLPPGETFNLELGLTGVAGVFRTTNLRSESKLQHRPIYRIDAEFCKRAKVDF